MAASSTSFSSFRYGDSLSVVAISALTAVLCEAISWLLIYRTSSYKSLRSSIDKASKKLQSMKSPSSATPSSSSSSSNPSSSSSSKGSTMATTTSSTSSSSSRARKMDRVEASLKESTRDLSLSKFKSGAVVAAVLFVVFGLLNSLFEGRAVAKLPFAPVPLVLKMSHRGLPGADPTDCSMPFLYFLCSISIRTNLQKLLGFAPPRGAAAAGGGLFPIPDPKTN
ncbi:calcium load-activated calcium channel-like [Ananas comosus]|uniref:Calcium load-activated calcium channel-like n=1 Tax=Ananas comosus TaxID=4615 RepID=A0A6P5G721_ANACO|nr:calcium load-activated calcium channel-like [Ananas comosus]